MNKPTICIDVDGTVADTYRVAMRFVKNRVRDYEKKSVDEVLGEMSSKLSLSEVLVLVDRVWRSGLEVPLIDKEIPKLIQKLRRHYEVCIITATPAPNKIIIGWLKEHRIVADRYMRFESTSEKIETEAALYVDDDLTIVKKLDEMGKQVLLIPQPWNKWCISSLKLSKNVSIVKDWKELVRVAIIRSKEHQS